MFYMLSFIALFALASSLTIWCMESKHKIPLLSHLICQHPNINLTNMYRQCHTKGIMAPPPLTLFFLKEQLQIIQTASIPKSVKESIKTISNLFPLNKEIDRDIIDIYIAIIAGSSASKDDRTEIKELYSYGATLADIIYRLLTTNRTITPALNDKFCKILKMLEPSLSNSLKREIASFNDKNHD